MRNLVHQAHIMYPNELCQFFYAIKVIDGNLAAFNVLDTPRSLYKNVSVLKEENKHYFLTPSFYFSLLKYVLGISFTERTLGVV